MNPETQSKFKEKLEKELKEVEGELSSVGRVNPNNPKDWEAVPDKMDVLNSDPNEVADKIESYEENAGILKQLEIRLNEIQAAFVRMQNGTYGACAVCKKEIDPKRLEANPAAATCTEHMS